jgi:hypothetical protein
MPKVLFDLIDPNAANPSLAINDRITLGTSRSRSQSRWILRRALGA